MFLKKVSVTSKILNVWALHPGCSLIDLARHGNALQLDEIAEHGEFVMSQLQMNEDEQLRNSELFRKSLPEFLQRYTKNQASVRKVNNTCFFFFFLFLFFFFFFFSFFCRERNFTKQTKCCWRK
jgi:hypothetical protein